MRPSSLIIDF